MKKNDQAVKLFKALGDEKRLQILDLLKDGELCACVLLTKLKLTQSGLSYHMKLLCDAGVVIPRPDGRWIRYRIADDAKSTAIDLLTEVIE